MELGWVFNRLLAMTSRRLASKETRFGLVLVGLAVLAVSCDPYPGLANHALGVRQEPGGEVLVRYVYCPGEVLERVQLILVVGDDPSIGDDDDRRLWEIIAARGEDPMPPSVIIGDAPPRFTELVPLRETLRPRRPYAVLIESNRWRLTVSVQFELGELRTDQVFSAEKYFSEQEFTERGMKKCEELDL